ncbi:L-serine ammonia-lyase, iron-sulfur-dependent, subunit alpha [Caloramator sp. mosi_1]|uniref:L-cysteine desulfidase family protein n=1 Tax=Caloramator sp. mosi_1 TaxID=3023090 RepID=UPI002361071E|nr:L-serine ammonia-lyase, iron-sulfur-dependent, subunit alpha [Caloramator sp. mosi_1]WDC85357.1 L-serine ammonia-lyase, iron-sulfur-dependent, subunit alpha [Caloramator sp. mosi_1]
MQYEKFNKNVLKQEVVLALGCTEPVAVALASASAYSVVKGEIDNINVIVSSNIFKNAFAVGIPGTKNVGLHIAAALGAVGGDCKLKLEVLKNINLNHEKQAKKIVEEGRVRIDVDDSKAPFYIRVEVYTNNGLGVCEIREKHSNIVYLEANGRVLYENREVALSNSKVEYDLKNYRLLDLIKCIEEMEYDELEFLLEGAEVNIEIAEEGLKNSYGMEIGKRYRKMIEEGILSNDIQNNIIMMTAAASDARMAGCFMPVMSSAGSGNHGITAIIPVAVCSKLLNKDKITLVKALAISHITTIYIKQFTGRLSSVCGCGVAAGVGAACGICYLLGGKEKEFEYTIKNMVGDISGVVCDGAKPGCAIKLSTAAAAAYKAALLANRGVYVPCGNGIVGCDIEATIRNLGVFTIEGMKNVDRTIINIMLKKEYESVC